MDARHQQLHVGCTLEEEREVPLLVADCRSEAVDDFRCARIFRVDTVAGVDDAVGLAVYVSDVLVLDVSRAHFQSAQCGLRGTGVDLGLVNEEPVGNID